MPYITQDKRPSIDKHVDLIAWNVESPGELNYAISRLLHEYLLSNNIECYEGYNAIIGVLEAAKLEFYRTVVAPYEDKKRYENGHVTYTPGAGRPGAPRLDPHRAS